MQTANTSSETFICSVVVPIRNNPQVQLRLDQWIDTPSARFLEIVIVQDCLNYKEGEEIRNWLEARNKKNQLYLEGNFGNPGAARNFGLAKSTSDWIAFWDADDVPDVNRFLTVLRQAQESEAELLIGSFRVRRDRDQSHQVRNYINRPNKLIDEIVMNPGLWRFAFKRELLKGSKFPISSMGEDQAFISSLSIFNRKIFQSDEVIYNYYTGEHGHLTNNLKLMGDMKVSLELLNHNRKRQNSESKRLTQSLIVKQLITSLKRGNPSLKFWAITELFHAFLLNPLNSSRAVILLLSWRSR
jgi:glycosyltransferase involved in cell wall biosynthesis